MYGHVACAYGGVENMVRNVHLLPFPSPLFRNVTLVLFTGCVTLNSSPLHTPILAGHTKTTFFFKNCVKGGGTVTNHVGYVRD